LKLSFALIYFYQDGSTFNGDSYLIYEFAPQFELNQILIESGALASESSPLPSRKKRTTSMRGGKHQYLYSVQVGNESKLSATTP